MVLYAKQPRSTAMICLRKQLEPSEHREHGQDDESNSVERDYVLLDAHGDDRLINNSLNLYIPIRLSCGVTTMCRPFALIHCPLVLLDINSDMYVPAATRLIAGCRPTASPPLNQTAQYNLPVASASRSCRRAFTVSFGVLACG
jgi:hypothetical protein